MAARVQLYVILVIAVAILAHAKEPDCKKVSPAAVCDANGVGIFCHPCNPRSYIVCAAYEPAQVETCAEGTVWDPSRWSCAPAADVVSVCTPGVDVRMPTFVPPPSLMGLATAGLSNMLASVGMVMNSFMASAQQSVATLEDAVIKSPFPSSDTSLSRTIVIPFIEPPIQLLPGSPLKPSIRSKMLLGHRPTSNRRLTPQQQDSILQDAAVMKEEAYSLMSAAAVGANQAANRMEAADQLAATVDYGMVAPADAPQVLDVADALLHSAKKLVYESEAMQENAEDLLTYASAKEDFALSAQLTPSGAATGADQSGAAAQAPGGAASQADPSSTLVLMMEQESFPMLPTGSDQQLAELVPLPLVPETAVNNFGSEEYYFDYTDVPRLADEDNEPQAGPWDEAWALGLAFQKQLWILAAATAGQSLAPMMPPPVTADILANTPLAAVEGPVDPIMALKRDVQLQALAEALQPVLATLPKEEVAALMQLDLSGVMSSNLEGPEMEPLLMVAEPLRRYLTGGAGAQVEAAMQEQLLSMFMDALMMVEFETSNPIRLMQRGSDYSAAAEMSELSSFSDSALPEVETLEAAYIFPPSVPSVPSISARGMVGTVKALEEAALSMVAPMLSIISSSTSSSGSSGSSSLGRVGSELTLMASDVATLTQDMMSEVMEAVQREVAYEVQMEQAAQEMQVKLGQQAQQQQQQKGEGRKPSLSDQEVQWKTDKGLMLPGFGPGAVQVKSQQQPQQQQQMDIQALEVEVLPSEKGLPLASTKGLALPEVEARWGEQGAKGKGTTQKMSVV